MARSCSSRSRSSLLGGLPVLVTHSPFCEFCIHFGIQSVTAVGNMCFISTNTQYDASSQRKCLPNITFDFYTHRCVQKIFININKYIQLNNNSRAASNASNQKPRNLLMTSRQLMYPCTTGPGQSCTSCRITCTPPCHELLK